MKFPQIMKYAKKARRIGAFALLVAVAAPAAISAPLTDYTGSASSSSDAARQPLNSDMMLSGPSIAEPIRLTVTHPKNTTVHLKIITDTGSSTDGVVEFTAENSADPTIAYSFPADQPKNIAVLDGAGREIWSLLNGQIADFPWGLNGGDDQGSAFLAQLDRRYGVSFAPTSLSARGPLTGVYTLRSRTGPEFPSSTDMAKTDSAGANHRWAHHLRDDQAPAANTQPSETTIIISPSRYAGSPCVPVRAPLQ